MTFRVEVTAEAEREADAILEWLLSQHAGDTGIRWFLELQDAIASLAEFPERCLLPQKVRFFLFKCDTSSTATCRMCIGFCSP